MSDRLGQMRRYGRDDKCRKHGCSRRQHAVIGKAEQNQLHGGTDPPNLAIELHMA